MRLAQILARWDRFKTAEPRSTHVAYLIAGFIQEILPAPAVSIPDAPTQTHRATSVDKVICKPASNRY
jgi:hypothetical protein